LNLGHANCWLLDDRLDFWLYLLNLFLHRDRLSRLADFVLELELLLEELRDFDVALWLGVFARVRVGS